MARERAARARVRAFMVFDGGLRVGGKGKLKI